MTTIGKVFAVLAIIAAGAFTYFAARVLKTHQTWRDAYVQDEKAHGEALTLARELDYGKPDVDPATITDPKEFGRLRLSAKLHELRDFRGRVWKDVKWAGAEGADSIKLAVDFPVPHQIQVDQVMHVFDGRPIAEGGQYLGEFRVTAAPQGQPIITLSPTFKAKTTRQIDLDRFVRRMQASGKADVPFILYDTMPVDSGRGDGGAFTFRSDADLEQSLPPSVVNEYKRDGKPAAEDDPITNVVTRGGVKVYRRSLRHYPTIFAQFDEMSTELIDEIAGYQRDIGEMRKVNEDLALEKEFYAKELAAAKALQMKVKGELDLVKGRQDALAAELDKMNGEVAKLLESVKAQETELENIYRQALEKADKAGAERTAAAR